MVFYSMSDSENNNVLKSGSYATKQIFSSCNLLRWSHQARFRKGKSIVSRFGARSILDYGCGDGTFLYFINKYFDLKVGMEIDLDNVTNLNKRFQELEGYRFIHVGEKTEQKFDIVTCFEVLEHCSDESIDKILGTFLKGHCKKDGHVIISVPKETGLTMIGKQLVRKILAYRKTGTYEYSEWYTASEFLKMLFATESTEINRKFYEIESAGSKYITFGHKGFNWKNLKLKISEHFVIEKIEFSPALLPYGLIASQVWFICRPK